MQIALMLFWILLAVMAAVAAALYIWQTRPPRVTHKGIEGAREEDRLHRRFERLK